MKNLLTRLVISTALVAAAMTGAYAKELRVASGAPPTHPGHNPLYTTFISALKVESGGELTARALGTEVVTLKGTITNLQSGVVDVANVLTLYFPAEFPHSMLINELAVLGSSGQAMTGAVTEYIFSCAPCLKEFSSKGLVFTGIGATTTYNLLTKKPVKTLADLKGLRLRSGGAPFTRWAEGMGIVPVEIGLSEEFEAISSGLIDGLITPPANLMGGKLYEILKYRSSLPIGTFHSAAGFTVRKETWNTLTDEQKGALLRAAIKGNATSAPGFAAIDAKAIANTETVEPAQDILDAHKRGVASAMETAVRLGKEKYKIANAQANVDHFARLVEKWNGIVAKIGENNVDAMAKSMQDEIFSKVDLPQYSK